MTNDSPFPFRGSLLLTSVDMITGQTTTIGRHDLALRAGAGVIEWITEDLSSVQPATQVVEAVVVAGSGGEVSHNVIPLVAPREMRLPNTTVHATVDSDASQGCTISVTVSSDHPALWVVLTTQAHGRFSDNAFLLVNNKTVEFLEFLPDQGDSLTKTLRVEHVAMYI